MSRVLFDAHHHLWRAPTTPRAGILGEPYLHRAFTWEDFAKAASGWDLDGTCLVEATSEPEEVALAEETSEGDSRLRTMVAFAPVEAPELKEVLAGLSRHAIVRGVRRSTQNEPDPDFILRPEFVAGARRVGEAGFLLELCVRLEQIAAVARFAHACPETVIVVQHLGKPDVTTEPGCTWLDAVDDLGGCPDVHMKVSPVVHTAHDPEFTLETQRPFIRHVVRCFGWDRILFGSNWPVSTAVTTYDDWVVTVAGSLPGASEEHLDALFHTNGRRLYCDART
ncbi:MAG: amidohydrolase family protein [Candidatus Dormibacteraeota bacterium]|nr:amidohydrolase family protein [Candidatus Dormibacteraeota bacterium]